MAKNLAQLHDELEVRSPEGVGLGISLSWLGWLCKAAIDDIASTPRPGQNVQIPLPATTKIQAAFVTSGNQFKLDPTKQTISLQLDIYLHLAGKPSEEIIRFQYAIKDAPIEPYVEQSTFHLYIQPAASASATLTGQNYNTNADKRLITAGYVTSAGTADRSAFEREVVYPLTWINAQGLILSVFRSLPVPQFLTGFDAIQPVVPVNAKLSEDYLIVWTEKAKVDLPICGAQKPPSGPPTTKWQLKPGSPAPSSPWDTITPEFGLYFAAQTILDWHAEVLMPAVMVSHTEEGIIGWRYDAAIGLKSLLVELVPAANGGSIVASAALALLGVASAWLNDPCGLRLGLIDAALQADGSAKATYDIAWDPKSLQVKSALDIDADIDKNSVRLSISGGLFGRIFGFLVDILYQVGVIKINTQYHSHSDSTLLDATTLLPFKWPSNEMILRVGRKSALISRHSRK